MRQNSVLVALSSRAEAIKMAPILLQLQKSACCKTWVCVTTPDQETLTPLLDLFNIQSDYHLDSVKPGQDLSDRTASILQGMREIYGATRPDMVLVQGDSASALAAALAAFYQKIPVGHVEAGLRTHNRYSPWPEEVNRSLMARLASYHFSPTEGARDNLIREGIGDAEIVVTGNTVIDALEWVMKLIEKSPPLQEELSVILARAGYSLSDRKIILVTGHRRESFGQGLISICEALKALAQANPSLDIVYPLRLNSNVCTPIHSILQGIPNIFLMELLEYQSFIYLMSHSYLVLTDSGGVQEEAPSLGKPVLVMRDSTERPEALEEGSVRLVGTHKETIIREVQALLDHPFQYRAMTQAHHSYGDGKASERINHFLKKYFISLTEKK